MNSDILYGAGLAGYLGLMILVGYLVKDKIKTSEDYLVAGRSFGVFFNSATLVACFIGGAVLIAAPGRIFSVGLWDDQWLSGGGLIILGGGLLCLVLTGTFYMKKLWRMKFISLGDFFYTRYGRKTGMISTMLLCANFMIWIAVQILVFGKIVNAIVGWDLYTSILVAMFVICTYTILGGLFAVCFTDIIQVSVTLLGLCVLVPFAISSVGGWGAFVDTYDTNLLNFIPQNGGFDPWLAWFATLSVVGLGSIVSPDLMQRAFSAKSPQVAQTSAFAASVVFICFAVLVSITALCGAILVSNGSITDIYLLGDEANGIVGDPEIILPVMSKAILPLPLVILFLGAALSAVMSAAATSSLALAGVISMNIYRDIINPKASAKKLVTATRVTVLIIGAAATVIAISYPNAVELSAFCFDLILASLFGSLTLGLFWKKANALGAIIGMCSGIIFRIVGGALDGGGFTLEAMAYPVHWYYFTIGSPLISMLTCVVISLLTQKINPPIALVEPKEQGHVS